MCISVCYDVNFTSLYTISYVWHELEDGQWGGTDENGNWTGAVAQVMRGVGQVVGNDYVS